MYEYELHMNIIFHSKLFSEVFDWAEMLINGFWSRHKPELN